MEQRGARPLFAMAVHVEERTFCAGWMVAVTDSIGVKCHECGTAVGCTPTIVSTPQGTHLTWEQLHQVWVDISAMLDSLPRKLLQPNDSMCVDMLWATYVRVVRDGVEEPAFWLASSGAAYLLSVPEITSITDTIGMFLRKVKDHGWEQFSPESERTPLPQAYDY